MRNKLTPTSVNHQSGFSLIELIAFLVIISVALVATLKVFNRAQQQSADPIIRMQALEYAQAQLDEILARKFDENTPTGGVPACGSDDGVACLGITTPDSEYDDVGDYHGFSQSHGPFVTNVTVIEAGNDLGISNNQARLITVVVDSPATSKAALGSPITLKAYKVNY